MAEWLPSAQAVRAEPAAHEHCGCTSTDIPLASSLATGKEYSYEGQLLVGLRVLILDLASFPHSFFDPTDMWLWANACAASVGVPGCRLFRYCQQVTVIPWIFFVRSLFAQTIAGVYLPGT